MVAVEDKRVHFISVGLGGYKHHGSHLSAIDCDIYDYIYLLSVVASFLVARNQRQLHFRPDIRP